MPGYEIPEEEVYDRNRNPRWLCTATINSHGLEEAYALSKKQ